jgi:hypothetical protein
MPLFPQDTAQDIPVKPRRQRSSARQYHQGSLGIAEERAVVLFPLEIRGAFFEEGDHAFFLIFCSKEQGKAAGFVGQG